MVRFGDILNILAVIALGLSLFSAKLVCDDPGFDRIPVLALLRRYAKCTAGNQPLPGSSSQAKPAAEGPTFKRDPTAPAWAKVIVELNRTAKWPQGLKAKEVGYHIAAKRVPQRFNPGPVKVLKDLDATILKEDVEFWKHDHQLKRRKDGRSMFVRETFDVDSVEGYGLDSAGVSPYFFLRNETLRVMYMDTMTTKVRAVSEFFSEDLDRILEVPLDAIKVHMPKSAAGETELGDKDLVMAVFTSAFEVPGVNMAAGFTSAHTMFLQMSGTRRILLFPPERWFDLNMYPFTNPRRRQSMWDFVSEDRLPSAPVPALQTELTPGDVLYIPPFWTVRTVVQDLPDDELLPSTFSISASALSFSSEQNVQAAVDNLVQVNDALDVVAAMVSPESQLQDRELRKRSALSLFVAEVYEQSGMGGKASIQRLVKRLTFPAELRSEFLAKADSRCTQEQKTDVANLELKAVDLMKNLAHAVAHSKSLLNDSYEELDERMGTKANRITAVWRIIVDNLVERAILGQGKTEFVALASCILEDAQR